MEPILVFDFETSGMPLWKEPSEDPGQPHIVQLGAVVFDAATRKPLQVLSLTVKPDGWDIDEAAIKAHGITVEHATRVGVPEGLVFHAFMGMWSRCTLRVAFNDTFDNRIARIACMRFLDEETADRFKDAPSACVMKMATPLCKLPPTPAMLAKGRKHYKSPSLIEAYRHFFGKPFAGAHNALQDARAAAQIYWKIKDLTPAGDGDDELPDEAA